MLRGSVAVAMSGGVDSAVSALLLKKSGYQVHGIFMRTWHAEEHENPLTDCPWQTDLNDARAVCEKLGITFEVVNMISKYKDLVVKELVDGYRDGTTPNPDILCNSRIKFGALKRYANGSGFDKFATGHYCRILKNQDGTVDILEGSDKNKDQSYFLAMLSQDQIKDVIFPIGHLNKQEVRKIAEQAELSNAKKKDSQGICFLGKIKIQDFLSHYIPDSPGDVMDVHGKVLGRHSGLFRFTVGQRHGMNLPSNLDFLHYVVIGKDLNNNRLIVEIEQQTSISLYKKEFLINGIRFTNKPLSHYKSLTARARYRDSIQAIEFFQIDKSSARVIFENPQRAIATGQVIAFYNENRLVGGGIFS